VTVMTRRHAVPDRLVMDIDPSYADMASELAFTALAAARANAPKLSGASSENMAPIWDDEGQDTWFGIIWEDDYVWWQNQGTNAFTMTHLEGRTIPMWIDDPDGSERQANPKAQVRMTKSGRTQVLVFRKVARKGQYKTVARHVRGQERLVNVPASFPGAPGRISRREAPWPRTAPGRVGGRIAKGNVGVRWRHPGLFARNFLHYGLRRACDDSGVPHGEIYAIRGTL
jgi:hypothetical protein